MDSILDSINPQVVLTVAAIAVALLLLRWLLRLLNVGLGTILTIVAIIVVLQYFFDISPRQLWFEISHLPQNLVHLANSFR